MAIPLRRSLAAGMGEDWLQSYIATTWKRQALLRRARSLHALDGIATVWVAHASRVWLESLAVAAHPLQRDLQQFQARQVLGIDNTNRDIVVINDDEIVNAMTLQQV